MNTSCYLIVNDRGSVRVTKGTPWNLGTNEVAIQLGITLEDSVFDRVISSVNLTIPAAAVIEPRIEVIEQTPEETI